MKSVALIALFATFAAGSVCAQTASFQCPASGTQFSYKGDGLEKVNTASGQDGTVCLYASLSNGKTETLRVHGGLVGSIDAQGESFAKGLDLKALWPLKVGNKITNTVTIVGRDGKSYTSTVTMTVVAYEKVTVPAGTFDAFRVEESKAESNRRDIHWWAPAVSASVKESFPDWRTPGKTITLDLVSLKPAAK
ncbi:hypothetical protein [Reyranella sp.]|uniref:hypothetical protein n=1 Tax=Reyranella sp. TaxID=1929291 RepID=UPI00403645E5